MWRVFITSQNTLWTRKEARKGLALWYLAIPSMFDDILSVQLHIYLSMITYAHTFVSVVITINHFVFHFIRYKYGLHFNFRKHLMQNYTAEWRSGKEKKLSSVLEWLVQHESISSYSFQKQVYGYHHGLNNLQRNIFLHVSILTNNFVLHSVFH